MKNILYIAVLMIASLAAQAQDLQGNYQWESTQSTNLLHNETVQRHALFISHGLQKISFIQKQGELTFMVTAVEGEWKDISKNGSVLLHVTLAGEPGIIELGQDTDGKYLLLDMTAASEDGIKQKFNISSVTPYE
jgi:hypothetical protein